MNLYKKKNKYILPPFINTLGYEELKGYYENNPYDNYDQNINIYLSRSKSMTNSLKN